MLREDWRNTTWHRREYFRVRDIVDWMRRRDSGQPNAIALLAEVQSRDLHQIYHITLRDLDEPNCLVVFAILLEIGYGELIGTFQRCGITDNMLETNPLHNREVLETDLGERNDRDPKDIIRRFEERRFSYRDLRLTYNMRKIFRDKSGRCIMPYCKREAVNEKGGTARMWQVLVPDAFIHKDLAAKLRHSKVEDPDHGTVCVMFAMFCQSASTDPLSYSATSLP